MVNKNNKDSKYQKEEFITNNFIALSSGSFADDNFRYQKKAKRRQEIFNQNYIITLNKNLLEETLKKVQDNNKMCDFIKTKISESNENETLFSNEKFIYKNI